MWIKDHLPDDLRHFFIKNKDWNSGRRTVHARLNYELGGNLLASIDEEVGRLGLDKRFLRDLNDEAKQTVRDNIIKPALNGKRLSARRVEKVQKQITNLTEYIPKKHRSDLLEVAREVSDPDDPIRENVDKLLQLALPPEENSFEHKELSEAQAIQSQIKAEIKSVKRDMTRLATQLEQAEEQGAKIAEEMERALKPENATRFRKEYGASYDIAKNIIKVMEEDPQRAFNMMGQTSKAVIEELIPSLKGAQDWVIFSEKTDALHEKYLALENDLSTLEKGLESVSEVVAHRDSLLDNFAGRLKEELVEQDKEQAFLRGEIRSSEEALPQSKTKKQVSFQDAVKVKEFDGAQAPNTIADNPQTEETNP